MRVGSFAKWADSQRQQQLRIGQEVEKEHTDDPVVAKGIAKDHLSEIDDYYTRLVKMERQAKREGHAEKKGFVSYFAEKKASLEQLPALMVEPEIQRRTDDKLTQLLESGKITAQQAKVLRSQALSAAKPYQREAEEKAYARESGDRALAPTTVGSTALALGIGAALPIGVNRIHRMASPLTEKMPWREALSLQFLPSAIPWTAGFEGLTHAMAPMTDPAYKRGDRGYLGSVYKSFRGAQEGLAERGAEVRQRLGVAGIPVQMFHGVMNPMASVANLGHQTRKALFGVPSDELLREAMARVAQTNGGRNVVQ
jgi:hypothetical protein